MPTRYSRNTIFCPPVWKNAAANSAYTASRSPAGHERSHQYGEDAFPLAIQRAGRHDRRDIAAKTHNQWHERFARNAQFAHELIHDERCPCHVAGFFQQA